MSYVDLSVFNQEDWEKIYNADSANKAAEYIIDSSMDTIRKTFEKVLTMLYRVEKMQ